MARRKFDPSRMTGAAPKAAETVRPLSVSELAWMVDGALKAGLPKSVRVVGEISNFTDRTHWYFNLKDADAVVSCVMFATAARHVSFKAANGQQVVASGRVEFYAKQGRTQFYVEAMEIVGAGALEARLRALVEELRALGWLDAERKRPLPTFPRRVAVVTSRTGAALQDVLDTMKRRCPAVDVALVDVRVQGEAAAPEVAAAIRWLSREHEKLGIDAVLVTRGGGSIEDLWAFNERIVAEAIVKSAVPVVAAIGHETDVTLAELVADERAATPTQAAMRLTPDRAALARQLDRTASTLTGEMVRRFQAARRELVERARLAPAMRHRLARQHAVLERLAARLARVRPEAVYAARRAAVQRVADRLEHGFTRHLAEAGRQHSERARLLEVAMRARLERQRDRVTQAERELAIIGPDNVLRRGYSVTFGPDGLALRSPSQVRAGDEITTRVAEGSLRSRVSGASEQSPAAMPTPLPARPTPVSRSRQRHHDASQMDLFR